MITNEGEPGEGEEVVRRKELHEWKGASGGIYRYRVLPLPLRDDFHAGREGNYIFARRNIAQLWVPIFIGSGDLGQCGGSLHPRWTGIEAHGATHLHVHLNEDELDRDAECDDILAWNGEAKFPTGCNAAPDHRFQPEETLQLLWRPEETGED